MLLYEKSLSARYMRLKVKVVLHQKLMLKVEEVMDSRLRIEWLEKHYPVSLSLNQSEPHMASHLKISQWLTVNVFQCMNNLRVAKANVDLYLIL